MPKSTPSRVTRKSFSPVWGNSLVSSTAKQRGCNTSLSRTRFDYYRWLCRGIVQFKKYLAQTEQLLPRIPVTEYFGRHRPFNCARTHKLTIPAYVRKANLPADFCKIVKLPDEFCDQTKRVGIKKFLNHVFSLLSRLPQNSATGRDRGVGYTRNRDIYGAETEISLQGTMESVWIVTFVLAVGLCEGMNHARSLHE